LSEISLEEYKLAYREVKKEEARRGFVIHLVAYTLVNSLLVVVNFLYSPNAIWFIYPMFFWGIGLSIHYFLGVRWIEKRIEEEEAKAEYRARTKRDSE